VSGAPMLQMSFPKDGAREINPQRRVEHCQAIASSLSREQNRKVCPRNICNATEPRTTAHVSIHNEWYHFVKEVCRIERGTADHFLKISFLLTCTYASISRPWRSAAVWPPHTFYWPCATASCMSDEAEDCIARSRSRTWHLQPFPVRRSLSILSIPSSNPATGSGNHLTLYFDPDLQASLPPS
jgi:hypothetical protein